MRIDKTHRLWLVTTAIVTAAGAAIYLIDARYGAGVLAGPSGGTVSGLAFGIAGAAFMLFSALLAGRKRLRSWRIGSSAFWLRAHLYLGALSLPMIWFHAGFRHGGTLSATLMWLLYAVIASGLLGALLQHLLPKQLTLRVTRETVYEQIPAVFRLLADEAELVAAGSAAAASTSSDPHTPTGLAATATLTVTTAQSIAGAQSLQRAYEARVRPFLAGLPTPGLSLEDPTAAASLFAQLRSACPPSMSPAVDRLESICAERRHLLRQQRLHVLLHAWLLIHIPLSLGLIVLGTYHAVLALHYLRG